MYADNDVAGVQNFICLFQLENLEDNFATTWNWIKKLFYPKQLNLK